MTTLHLSVYPMRSKTTLGMNKPIVHWALKTVGAKRARRNWLTKDTAIAEARKAIVRAGGFGNIYVHDDAGKVGNVIQLIDVQR